MPLHWKNNLLACSISIIQASGFHLWTQMLLINSFSSCSRLISPFLMFQLHIFGVGGGRGGGGVNSNFLKKILIFYQVKWCGSVTSFSADFEKLVNWFFDSEHLDLFKMWQKFGQKTNLEKIYNYCVISVGIWILDWYGFKTVLVKLLSYFL